MRSKKQIKEINEEALKTITDASKQLSMILDIKNNDGYLLLFGVEDSTESGTFVSAEIGAKKDTLRNMLEAVMLKDESLLHTVIAAVSNVLEIKAEQNGPFKPVVLGDLPNEISELFRHIMEDEPKTGTKFDPNNPNIN